MTGHLQLTSYTVSLMAEQHGMRMYLNTSYHPTLPMPNYPIVVVSVAERGSPSLHLSSDLCGYK